MRNQNCRDISPDADLKYRYGDIVRDVDFTEDILIIIDVFVDGHGNFEYELFDLQDTSRRIFCKYDHLNEWYEVIS